MSDAFSLPSDHPFRSHTALWLDKITTAEKYRQEVWGSTADECMRFYCSDYSWFFKRNYALKSAGTFMSADGDVAESPMPSWCFSINKAAEVVAVYGPNLYFRDPVRTATPREFPDLLKQVQQIGGDMMAQTFATDIAQRQLHAEIRAELMQKYLNYTPNELGLREECRLAIVEALIKGRGCMWTELYQPPGSPMTMVGSFHDTCDNLVIDPDAERLVMPHCGWIARRRIHPTWIVEQRFKLPRGSLAGKGNFESFQQHSKIVANGFKGYQDKKAGKSADLMVYYDVYSAMGIGDRLKEAKGLENFGEVFDQFPPFMFFAICDKVPFPLNLPPSLLDVELTPAVTEQIRQAISWPIPFWADNRWPVSCLDFYPKPRCPYPMSILEPALGELKFLQWAASFIASKVAKSSRDLVAVLAETEEEFKRTLLEGKDYEILALKGQHKTVSDVVQFIRGPEIQASMWDVIHYVEGLFDRRTGLNEVLFAESNRQWRSAQEANVKGSMAQIRPDDLRARTEDWACDMAAKEALGARWCLSPQDVSPAFGPHYANLWRALVYSQDVGLVSRELEYRVEAGSMSRPNIDRDRETYENMAQTLVPMFRQNYDITGDPTQINAWITGWARSQRINPQPLLLPPRPPPPQPMPAPAPAA